MKIQELPETLVLGERRWLEWVTYGTDEVVGAIEHHPRARATELGGHLQELDSDCQGAVFFNVQGVPPSVRDRQLWTVVSWQPLELSPSLHCLTCGNHGWIKGGKWIPA